MVFVINWAKILPVLVSILIIIAIAILREYSRPLAVIVAVMPLNVPLGMWIVMAGEEQQQEALIYFTHNALINIFPTVFFILAAWQAAKSGLGTVPSILIGYGVWGVSLAVIFGLRAWLGF